MGAYISSYDFRVQEDRFGSFSVVVEYNKSPEMHGLQLTAKRDDMPPTAVKCAL